MKGFRAVFDDQDRSILRALQQNEFGRRDALSCVNYTTQLPV